MTLLVVAKQAFFVDKRCKRYKYPTGTFKAKKTAVRRSLLANTAITGGGIE